MRTPEELIDELRQRADGQVMGFIGLKQELLDAEHNTMRVAVEPLSDYSPDYQESCKNFLLADR